MKMLGSTMIWGYEVYVFKERSKLPGRLVAQRFVVLKRTASEIHLRSRRASMFWDLFQGRDLSPNGIRATSKISFRKDLRLMFWTLC